MLLFTAMEALTFERHQFSLSPFPLSERERETAQRATECVLCNYNLTIRQGYVDLTYYHSCTGTVANFPEGDSGTFTRENSPTPTN